MTSIKTLFFNLLIAAALSFSAAFGTVGCEYRACPPGMEKNRTGDCVPVGMYPGDDDNSADVDFVPVGDEEPAVEEWTDDDSDADGEKTDSLRACSSDLGCYAREICHSGINQGICLQPCEKDSFCEERESGTFCNSEGRCIKKSGVEGCFDDEQCAYGKVCHKEAADLGVCAKECETNDVCAALGAGLICRSDERCGPALTGQCQADYQCAYGELCNETVKDGTCLKKCQFNADCPSYPVNYLCGSEGKCFRSGQNGPCKEDAQCSFGSVCHDEVSPSGLCATLCDAKEFCEALGGNLFCNSNGRCAVKSTSNGCLRDEFCPIGTVCHKDASADGACAPPCDSQSACETINANLYCDNDKRCSPNYSAACDEDLTCKLGEVCHHPSDNQSGICGFPCASNAECAQYGEDLFCNAARRCVQSVGLGCKSDADCGLSEVCHADAGDEGVCAAKCVSDDDCVSVGGAGFFCNSANHCRDGSSINGCATDGDCKLFQICHAQAVEGGVCGKQCTSDADCSDLGAGLFCNSGARCSKKENPGCKKDSDCGGGYVCHAELSDGNGICAKNCTQSSECKVLQENTFCNTKSRCRVNKGSGCSADEDCPVFTVCHSQAISGGLCAPACQNDELCGAISSNLYCSALNRCMPKPIDGDVDLEAEQDSDNDVEKPDCLTLRAGETYNVELKTYSVTVSLSYAGSAYKDSSGRSSLYFRDKENGNQFKIAGGITDGSNIPAVRIIKGKYDLIFSSPLDQRATIKENVEVSSDSAISADVPLIEMTVVLKKNGSPFPSLNADRCGKLYLYEQSRNAMYLVSPNVGCDAAGEFKIYVLSSTFSVIFKGHLSNETIMPTTATLLSNLPLTADKKLELDIKTYKLDATLTYKRGDFGDEEMLYGDLWAKNIFTNDLFPVASVKAPGQPLCKLELIKDSYRFYYRPKYADGFNSYIDDSVTNLCLMPVSGDVDVSMDDHKNIDFSPSHIAGTVTYRGAAMQDKVYQKRGYIVATNVGDRSSVCPVIDLKKSGQTNFDAYLAGGNYDLKFVGPLVDSSYLADRTWPNSLWNNTIATNLDWTSDKPSIVVDIPALRITGSISVNGKPLIMINNASQFLSVLEKSTYSTIVALIFENFTGPNFVIDVFKGSYQPRFQGDLFTPDEYQLFALTDFFDVNADMSYDFNLFFRKLSFSVTVNQTPLYNLYSTEVFDIVEIDASDRTMHSRVVASSYVDENNVISFLRPDGSYDFIFYAEKGDSYVQYPLIKGDAVSSDKSYNFDVALSTYRIVLTRDGAALPDDTKEKNRGEITFRNSADYYIVNAYDLGATGVSSGDFKAVPGIYTVNFQSGYGSEVFPINQWKNLQCVELLP